MATIERLQSQVALGSILYGGHFVLAYWPEFEAARGHWKKPEGKRGEKLKSAVEAFSGPASE